MVASSGAIYRSARRRWTTSLLVLCYCLCCHGGFAANISIAQPTSVPPSLQYHTDTLRSHQSKPNGTTLESSEHTVSQFRSSLDSDSGGPRTERVTSPVGTTVSSIVSNYPAEAFVSTTASVDKLSTNFAQSTNVTLNTIVETTTNVESTTNVVTSLNGSSTNVSTNTNESTSNVTSGNFASSPDRVSSVTSSLASPLFSVQDDDAVTLNPMSVIEKYDLVTATESDISSEAAPTSELEDLLGNDTVTSSSATSSKVVTMNATIALQTVKSHLPAEMFTSLSSKALTTSLDNETASSVAMATTLPSSNDSSSHELFYPRESDNNMASLSTMAPVTMDTTAVTMDTMHVTMDTTPVTMYTTSVTMDTTPITMDKTPVTMDTTHVPETSSSTTLFAPSTAPPSDTAENVTQRTVAPSTTRSTPSTSTKPPTTIPLSDKFTKLPKSEPGIKIADMPPTRFAAWPTEKPMPFTKYPSVDGDAPHAKHTTPTVSVARTSPTPRLPMLYVTLVIKTSWGEFCANLPEFRVVISKLLGVKMNRNIAPDQVRLMEDDRCQERTARSVQIAVGVYVVNPKGAYDFDMSSALAKLMLVDQIRHLAGTTFEDKILDFKIHGKVADVRQEVAPDSVDHPPGRMDRGVVIAIVISCLAGLCVVSLIILQVVYVKRRRGVKRMRKSFRDRYSVDINSVAGSMAMREVNGRRSNRFGYDNPALNWCEVKDYTSNVLDPDGLANIVEDADTIEDEFLLLPSQMPRLSDVPLGAEDKNRYANVIPNPETRVHLTLRKGEDNSDYINANYLRGYLSSPRGYIATQAPLEGTCADFWRMAWEQRCQIIVLLTGLEEHGLSKCVEYWPNTDGGDIVRVYGDFEITQQRRVVRTEWIMSMITIRYMKTNQCHEIRHFWMTAWPVNGLPDARTIIHFLIALRPYLEETTAPPIIHCSPGTGRTGTLIAIDLGMLSYDDTKMVDILAAVYRMRQDRGGMVQTREQYEYIYKVLYEYMQMKASDT